MNSQVSKISPCFPRNILETNAIKVGGSFIFLCIHKTKNDVPEMSVPDAVHSYFQSLGTSGGEAGTAHSNVSKDKNVCVVYIFI